MQQLGQYVLSLTAVAIICAVVLSMFRDGTVRNLLRMVCGIVLMVAALSPLTDFQLPDFSVYTESWVSQGKAFAAIGEKQAVMEKQQCIQRQLEAYILDKADSLEAAIRPEVTLDERGAPVEVRLYGQCSDQIRQTLSTMITNDLGIPEEDQKWIGQM